MIARASSLVLVLSTPLLLAGAQPAEEARYNACFQRIETDADAAFEFALNWRTHGGGVPARHCAALAMVALGHAEEAAVRLQELAQGPGGHGAALRVELLAQAADAWTVAARPSEAMAVLSQAAALASEERLPAARQAALYARRAELAAVSGLEGEAMRDADRALSLAETAQAYVVRAGLLRRQRRYPEAERDLESALRLAPGSPEALFERALLARDRLEIGRARTDFLAAILADEDAPLAELARRELEALDLKPD